MGSWNSESDEPIVSGHTLALLFGFGALLVGAFFVQQGMARSQWPTATAQILSVDVKCRMSVMGRNRWFKPGPVLIGCDQVDRFRRDNTDRPWTASRIYSGKVEVSRDGRSVTLVLPLQPRDVGKAPVVGETFPLVQNPDSPTDVAFVERSLTETLVGLCVGGFGIFLLLVAFLWL